MLNITKKDNINGAGFWWNISLKSVFVIILLYFLYRQVFLNADVSQSWELFKENLSSGNKWALLICLMLMPVNWIIESLKWQILVRPFEEISFLRSFKAILSGISVALLTPNRIGEYGGRMVMVDPKHNWKAVISTLVSSFAQNICNIGLGLIAVILLLRNRGDIEGYLFLAAISIALVFLGLLVFLYFNIEIVNRLLSRWQSNKRIGKALRHLSLLEKYKAEMMFKVLILAFVRYFVYFLQYYLILRFFGIELDVQMGFIGIGTIFLVQTSIPLPPILGFLARGEIALVVWETMEYNDLSILSSSYSLWFLNLIIPAMAGSILILSSNLWRSLGLARGKFRPK